METPMFSFYSIFFFFGSAYNLIILLDYPQFKYYKDEIFFMELVLTFGVISYNMGAFSAVIKDYKSSRTHPLVQDYMYIIRSLGRSTTDSLDGYLFPKNLSDKIFLLVVTLAGIFSLTSIRNPYWDVSVYFNLYIVISYLPALIFTCKKLIRMEEKIQMIDRKIDQMESATRKAKQVRENSITGTINELNVVNIKICKHWNATADIFENSILVASIHLITKLTLFATYTIKAYYTRGRCSNIANLEILDFFLLIFFFICRAVYFQFIEEQIQTIKKSVKKLLKKNKDKNARIEEALKEFLDTHETVYGIGIPKGFFERLYDNVFVRSEENRSPIDVNILKDISILTLNLFIVIMTTKILLNLPNIHANDLCNLYELPNTYIHKSKWFLLLLFVKLNVLEKYCNRLCNNPVFEIFTCFLIFFLFHINSFYNLQST